MRDTRWKFPAVKFPGLTDHFGDLILLGMIAAGIIYILVRVIDKGVTGWDVAACLLVLQGIITAVKDRWSARSTDRAVQQLGQSSPPSEGPARTPLDPLSVVEESRK